MAIKDDMEDVQEAVINELITDNGLTPLTVGDGQVTTPKIANGAVTAAKLGSDVDLTPADGSITPAKLDRDYLEITTTGVDVTGTVTADGLTVDGNATLQGTGDVILTLSSDTDNSGEDDSPTIIMTQDGGSHYGHIGVNGQANTKFTGAVANTPYVYSGVGFQVATNAKVSARPSITVGSTGDISFYENTGTTAKLLWDASAENLGIGTSPQSFAKLQVKTDTNKHVAMFTNAAGATIGGITDTGGSASLRIAGAPLIMTGGGGSGTEHMRIQADGTIKISNSSTPSTPSGGGVLYVQNGALKFKGSSGTVTTIANA